MTTLGNLGTLPVVLSNSLLSNSPLWQREVRTVTPTDLVAFVALHRNTSRYLDALFEADTVVNAGLDALDSGELNHAPFTTYSPPESTFTSSDLIGWLSSLSLVRRRAILFALEMKMHPRDVIALTWRDLPKHDLTVLAHELVVAMPRHIRLNYVFWDYLSNGSIAPLFGLGESALECSHGMGFEAMLRRYEKMVMIDGEADMKSFVQEFNTEINDRMNW